MHAFLSGSLFYDMQNERDVAIIEGRVWREKEEGESKGEGKVEEKEEEKGEGEEYPDVRVQMEPVPWPNERMHNHIRFLLF